MSRHKHRGYKIGVRADLVFGQEMFEYVIPLRTGAVWLSSGYDTEDDALQDALARIDEWEGPASDE